MTDIIKDKNTYKDDNLQSDTYESIFANSEKGRAAMSTAQAIDFKNANVVKVNPPPGDVSVSPAKFETAPGGRILAIKGALGPVVTGVAGEPITKGQTVMLLSNSKFYLTDSATNISDRYVGVALADFTEGEQAQVQSIGVVDAFTGLTPSSIYYLTDGTVDASVTPNQVGNLQVYEDAANNVGVHQRFTTSADMVRSTTVEVYLGKTGSPTGNVNVEIYAISGSDPTGSALWTSQIDVTTLPVFPLYTTFNLDVDIDLSPSTTYTMRFSDDNSGVMNSTNCANLRQQLNPAGVFPARTSAGVPPFFSWSDSSVSVGIKVRRGSGTISTTPGLYTKKAGLSYTSTQLDIIKT